MLRYISLYTVLVRVQPGIQNMSIVYVNITNWCLVVPANRRVGIGESARQSYVGADIYDRLTWRYHWPHRRMNCKNNACKMRGR